MNFEEVMNLYQQLNKISTFQSIVMFNEEPPEETECTCGRSGDGHCHCCECNQEQPPIYEEIDDEEFINQLKDWD